MTKIIFTALLLLSPLSHAEETFNLLCMTEFPTTSFVVRDVEDKTVVEVFHHNGTKYMPIFDGVATPNDISTLNDKASVLTDLGSYLRFEWPREKCKKTDDLVQQCFGNSDTLEINGHKISAWNFDSSLVMQKSMMGKFNSYKLMLNLDVDGQSLYIPMKYDVSECSDQMTMRAKPVLERIRIQK